MQTSNSSPTVSPRHETHPLPKASTRDSGEHQHNASRSLERLTRSHKIPVLAPHRVLINRYKDQVAMMKSALLQEQDAVFLPEVKQECDETSDKTCGERNAPSCVITRCESVQRTDDVLTRTLTETCSTRLCALTKRWSHVSRVPSCSEKRSLSRVHSRTIGRAQMNEEMYDDCGRGVFVREVSRVIEDFMDECLFEGTVPE